MSEEAELMEFFESKKSEIVSLKNRIDSTDRDGVWVEWGGEEGGDGWVVLIYL